MSISSTKKRRTPTLATPTQDVSKAGELIGYEPSTHIRKSVSKFIDWYEANREWYEPLVVNS